VCRATGRYEQALCAGGRRSQRRARRRTGRPLWGGRVLEVGCGVGAQTVHLVTAGPEAYITSVDVCEDSLAQARARVAAHAPWAAVEWRRADLFDLPYGDAEFDHLFVCFVLEHLPDPRQALAGLRRVLRPGGSITP
jgi:ubiquinone/menaquinone biosynthesis C-methylase UbiE